MKRIIVLLAVSALLVLALAVPAFAAPSFNAQDDKNNPTFPSTGAGKKPVNANTAENIAEVCAKNPQAAQCYGSPPQ